MKFMRSGISFAYTERFSQDLIFWNGTVLRCVQNNRPYTLAQIFGHIYYEIYAHYNQSNLRSILAMTNISTKIVPRIQLASLLGFLIKGVGNLYIFINLV